jgi:sugar/nucleoside kinase (ribokinase family)
MPAPPPRRPTGIYRGVAVVGSTTIDRNVIDGRSFCKLGGATTYAGITYRRHGVPTRVVTNVAAADRPIIERMQREGVEVACGASAATTRFVNRVEGGVRSQHMPAWASPITAEQARVALQSASCVHLAPLHPADIDPSVIDMLHGSRLRVVLDAQGYVRRIARGRRVAAHVCNALASALRAAHVVKTDFHELNTILNSYGSTLLEAIQEFQIAEWIVTRGERGGFIQDVGGTLYPYDALAAEPLVDPTGAGDVFLAAYTAVRVFGRKPIGDAARHAARTAAAHAAGRYVRPARLNWIDKGFACGV